MKALLYLGIFSVLALLAVPEFAAANPNLVVNGGFETGDSTGFTAFGNDFAQGVFGKFVGVNPYSGKYQAAFGAVGSEGGIAQTLKTVVGKTYDINFELYDFGGAPSEYTVMFGNNVLVDKVDSRAFGYTDFNYTAVATSKNTVISFGFRNDPAYLLLDDISVSAASVPDVVSTCLTLTLAMLGLAALRRALA